MSKGQLTSFIIVGIVLLFALGFAVYLATTLKTPQPNIDTPPERGNFRACLEQALDLAMQSVAERGGADLTGTNAVQLTQPQATSPTTLRYGIIEGPPVLPGAYVQGYSQSGIYWFEPLCLLQGTNRPQTALHTDCLPGTYQLGEPNTAVLQHQLAERTSANAQLCGVTDPVAITFGADDVTATAGDLSVRSTARFKRLYNAARTLAVRDARDPFFDKRTVTQLPGCDEPSAGNECLLKGMVVTITDLSPADVVTITDAARTVAGRPLSYSFAVQNRAPLFTTFVPVLPLGGYSIDSNTPFTIEFTAVDGDEFDTVAVTCAGPLVQSCQSVQTEFTTKTTVTLAGCTTTAPGTQSQVTLTLTDGDRINTGTVPVFVRATSSCP